MEDYKNMVIEDEKGTTLPDQNDDSDTFAWLDQDYNNGEDNADISSALSEATFDIPIPSDINEVIKEIENGKFLMGVSVLYGNETLSERSYEDIVAKISYQYGVVRLDFSGKDMDLQALYQQLEIYAAAAEKHSQDPVAPGEEPKIVTCALMILPDKYMSTISFEVGMPQFWAFTSDRIGEPADMLRIIAPSDFVAVYETGITASDVRHEVEEFIAEEENNSTQNTYFYD